VKRYIGDTAKPAKMYYVQVGAFKTKENAEAYLETVKREYPDAFIKEL
jgi:cell division septation protein DedD